MDLKKIFTTIYSIIIILLVALSATVTLMHRNDLNRIQSNVSRFNSFVIADELRQSSEDLTRYCRTYAATGDSIWEKKYWDLLDIRNGKKPQLNGRTISLTERMKELGFSEDEFAKLNEAEQNSNNLVWIEKIAFHAVKGFFVDSLKQFSIKKTPDTTFATSILFDKKYHYQKSIIMKPIDDFIIMVKQRKQNEYKKYTSLSNKFLNIIIGLVSVILIISIISFVLIKKQLVALKLSEQSHKKLIEETLDGIYKTTHAGKFVEANSALVKMLGYNSKEELLAVDIKESLYIVDSDREDDTSVGLNSELIIYRLRKKDKSIIWVEDHGSYSYNKLGEVIYHEGIVRDVTERVNKEQELFAAKEKIEKSDELYRLVIAVTNLGIWDYNVTEDIMYFSKLWKAQVGYEENELENTLSTWQSLLHPDDYNKANKSIEDYLENPKGQYISEFRLRHKDGSYIWISARAEAIMNNKREFTRMFGSHTDISERKIAEFKLKDQNIELVKAKDKAEESDQLKSAFLSNMSHEIRTPMNGILGFSELLKEPGLTGERQREYIGVIEKSGERMLNIINDIVSISKIESGLMDVNIQSTDIKEQIDFVHSFFKLEMEGKGISFLIKNSLKGKENNIQSDIEKIYGILINLIKNALKFTKEGTIELGCRLRKEKESSELEFYVRDTGIGIPENRQKPIFHRFVQADVSGKMAYQGAGLGLSISKAYVELLGGKIWVESKEGKGSVFYFTIPYLKEQNEKNSNKNEG
jgi:PAS domain S-box-containing protein